MHPKVSVTLELEQEAGNSTLQLKLLGDVDTTELDDELLYYNTEFDGKFIARTEIVTTTGTALI